MKAFFLAGSAALLLACGATVSPAMAGGKIVNLTLRVLVDGPPPWEARWSSAVWSLKALMASTTVSRWATP